MSTDTSAAHEEAGIMGDGERIREIIERHRITTERLSLETGLSRSHLDRIMLGDRPATTAVWRAVWRLTADPEVLRCILGGESLRVMVEESQRPAPPLAESYMELCREMGELGVHMGRVLGGASSPLHAGALMEHTHIILARADALRRAAHAHAERRPAAPIGCPTITGALLDTEA